MANGVCGAGTNAARIVATPIIRKTVKGWLCANNRGPHPCYFYPDAPFLLDGQWHGSYYAAPQLGIPEDQWPAPGESSAYELEVEAVVGESK
jgi:hypothetical protein